MYLYIFYCKVLHINMYYFSVNGKTTHENVYTYSKYLHEIFYSTKNNIAHCICKFTYSIVQLILKLV